MKQISGMTSTCLMMQVITGIDIQHYLDFLKESN